MFQRIISVDWSGAGNEMDGVDLRVAMFDGQRETSDIVPAPNTGRTTTKWSRGNFRRWITNQLSCSSPPTLLAMDFGFGLPWKSDEAIFGVKKWRDMVKELARKYQENEERESRKKQKKERRGSSRTTAEDINRNQRFSGHGPYRFNDSRTDYRFYIEHGVAYYRITELCCPQAISQWYLGSGGTVGFHTISGLFAINSLIELRDAGKIDFVVWPHECREPDGNRHVIAESYPSICPAVKCTKCGIAYASSLEGNGSSDKPSKKREGYIRRFCGSSKTQGIWQDANKEDAWKVLQMLVAKRANGTLKSVFRIPEVRFGRFETVAFEEQVQFEGWIIGLNVGDE